MTASRAAITVSPLASTALPAVAIVCTVASRGDRPCGERAAETDHDEQRVVDPERDREHHREVHRPDGHVEELPADEEQAAGAEQPGHRQQERQAGRRQRAEREHQQRERERPRQRLGLHHRGLVGVVEVGPHGGRAGEAHGHAGLRQPGEAVLQAARRLDHLRRRRARQPGDDRGAAVPRNGGALAGREHSAHGRVAAQHAFRTPATRGAHRRARRPRPPTARTSPARGSATRSRGEPRPTPSREPPSRRPRAPGRRTARALRGRARPRPRRRRPAVDDRLPIAPKSSQVSVLMPATVRPAARRHIGHSPDLLRSAYSPAVRPCLIANRLACARLETPSLRVDVLDVAARRLARDHELLGDLLVRQPAHEQPQHLDLAAREAAGPIAPALDGMARRAQHGLDRVAVEQRLADARAQLGRGLLGGARIAVRPRLGHRVIGVGRREYPPRRRERVAGQPARIAGAVEPLVVLDRDRAQRGQRLRRGEHPLGQVGMQAHPFELGRGERPALVPDRVRDAQATEIVHQPRPAHELGVVVRTARRPSRPRTRGRPRRASDRSSRATSGR